MNPKIAAWVIGSTLYVLCPLDFDFVPFFGWIDDAFVVWLAAKNVLREMRRNVIDV
jgi:uncharacterized membrane protein YkvA (DUF1232 family)